MHFQVGAATLEILHSTREPRERQQLAAALVVNVSIKVAKRRQRIRDVADPTRLRNAASYDTYSSLFAAISECKQQQ